MQLSRLFLFLVIFYWLTACGNSTTNSSASNSGGSVAQLSLEPHPLANNKGWVPASQASYALQLTGTPNMAAPIQVAEIDLFDTPSTTIRLWQQQSMHVICYFSAGTRESWRPDSASFSQAVIGLADAGWSGENWIDIRSLQVRQIMLARLDLAVSKGCDGVDPDNVNGYTNATGFPLTAQDQLDFNVVLANAAHSRGLATALKNDSPQIALLANYVDFAINEQCHESGDCQLYQPLLQASKLVVNIEYSSTYVQNTQGAFTQLCQQNQAMGIETLILPQSLNGSYRYTCP
ncbi:MAG: endo alpha-1,4 polygalactosaminidase [Pseudomonadales bacterium]|nr:endo alpha-1,4 polygalactosaminidase [Pseudomonadales bacterium]